MVEQRWSNPVVAISASHRQRFGRNESRGFFARILPESAQRGIIARNLGISSRNDFAMLDKISGECAGAVTFVSEGRQLPELQDEVSSLVEANCDRLLRK